MFALIEKKHPAQTTKEFCAANGLSEASYYYWLKKSKQSSKVAGSGFIPVQFASSDRLVLATIQLPGGSIISVYDLQVISFMQPYL
jgi:hypothetical protein